MMQLAMIMKHDRELRMVLSKFVGADESILGNIVLKICVKLVNIHD